MLVFSYDFLRKYCGFCADVQNNRLSYLEARTVHKSTGPRQPDKPTGLRL
jgi:hypothetical protein